MNFTHPINPDGQEDAPGAFWVKLNLQSSRRVPSARGLQTVPGAWSVSNRPLRQACADPRREYCEGSLLLQTLMERAVVLGHGANQEETSPALASLVNQYANILAAQVIDSWHPSCLCRIGVPRSGAI